MKIRILLITAMIFSLFAMTSCNKDSNPVKDLKAQVPEIESLEKRSAELNNAEEAFTLMADLNQVMKDVRNATLAMDAKYKNCTKAEKKEMEKEFEAVVSEFDESLQVIRENIKEYEDSEEVEKMITKLNQIMNTK